MYIPLDLKIIKKRILKLLIQIRIQIIGKKFYCEALTGISGYDICINSDMTVSCSFQDNFIGDLSSNSLSEIFHGPIAKRYRRKFAEGKFPDLTCISCEKLHLIDKHKSGYYKQNVTFPPKGILLENTIKCNLSCRACPRKTVLRKSKTIRNKSSLSLADIKKVSLILKKHNIKELFFFKFGEPFMSSTINEELKIIRDDNPELKIIVSTNGTVLNNRVKQDAALMLDLIYFSIDGTSDEIVRKYQRGGSFEKAYDNMKELVKLRNLKGLDKPVIEWKYVLFNWNDRRKIIFQAIKLAKQAGVDIISFWPARKPVYGIPWRYYLYPYFNNIGHKSWKGREIIF